MSHPIIKEWVEALRSGKFKQGKGYLKADDCYCCLGVLCEISPGFKGWVKGTFNPRNRYVEQPVFEHGQPQSTRFLPEKLREEFGLNSHTGELMGMNDSGCSFEAIADYIEKNILAVSTETPTL